MAYSGMLSSALIALTLLTFCSALAKADVSEVPLHIRPMYRFMVMVRDKCILAAGTEKGDAAFNAIEIATTSVEKCIANDHKATSMDDALNKFCERNQALECIEPYAAKWAACLEKDEQDIEEIFMRIVNNISDYYCHNGTDEMKLFMAGTGFDCLITRQEELRQCFMHDSIRDMLKFVLDKKCHKMEQLEQCVIEKLDSCNEQNIFKYLFRTIKNEMLCSAAKVAKRSGAKSKATALLSNNGSELVLALLLVYAFRQRLQ